MLQKVSFPQWSRQSTKIEQEGGTMPQYTWITNPDTAARGKERRFPVIEADSYRLDPGWVTFVRDGQNVMTLAQHDVLMIALYTPGVPVFDVLDNP